MGIDEGIFQELFGLGELIVMELSFINDFFADCSINHVDSQNMVF